MQNFLPFDPIDMATEEVTKICVKYNVVCVVIFGNTDREQVTTRCSRIVPTKENKPTVDEIPIDEITDTLNIFDGLLGELHKEIKHIKTTNKKLKAALKRKGKIWPPPIPSTKPAELTIKTTNKKTA